MAREIGVGTNIALLTDGGFDVDTSDGAVTIQLQKLSTILAYYASVGSQFKGYNFADISANAGTNNILITCHADDLVNGASSVTIAVNGASGQIQVAGDGWSVTSSSVSNAPASTTKGSVTQETNINTGVTLNTDSGLINVVDATFTAGEIKEFTLTNNKITTTSVILLTFSCTTSTANLFSIAYNTKLNGSVVISFRNQRTTSSGLSGGTVNFQIIN